MKNKIILKLTCLVLLGGLLFGGCTPKEPPSDETLMTFFYVVNQTGQDIRVRVLADHQELFIVEIGSEVELPDEGRISPPQGEYPAKELKISMPKDTKVIKAQELISGREQEREVKPLTSKVNGGFTIIIKEDEILLERGYLPIR